MIMCVPQQKKDINISIFLNKKDILFGDVPQQNSSLK